MITTPPIPNWIRDYRTTSYRNIYELCPGETRLYGTESLYGDWDGELLLMAKDFAPSQLVLDRQAAGEAMLFHHTDWVREPTAPAARTNRTLYRLAERIECGKLYGSSLAGLLRTDGQLSGALSEKRQIGEFVCEVLRFTISQMPRLVGIACLGVDAWEWTTQALGLAGHPWGEHRARREPLVTARGIRLFALAHPSRTPGGRDMVERDWEVMGRAISMLSDQAKVA